MTRPPGVRRVGRAGLAALLCLSAADPAVPAPAPTVAVIAHRGASHDAPENTVAALREAWRQKADIGEFDVWLTRDGHVVALHDKSTRRTAGVAKTVSESTPAELRELDVGRWKDARFAGERIPTLAEMLAAVPAGKGVFIEVKCGPEIVPELLRVLRASGLPAERTAIISFSASVLAAVKKARPELPAYWVVAWDPAKPKAPTAAELIARARAIPADGLDLAANAAVDGPLLRQVRAAGLKLFVWTVDDPAPARRLTALGVDGITTNRPALLRGPAAP